MNTLTLVIISIQVILLIAYIGKSIMTIGIDYNKKLKLYEYKGNDPSVFVPVINKLFLLVIKAAIISIFICCFAYIANNYGLGIAIVVMIFVSIMLGVPLAIITDIE